MRIPLRAGTMIRGVLAAGAVLAPVRFSSAEAMVPSAAECTTCCTKEGRLCVVCSKTCTTVTDAYDIGSGPCPSDDDPNIT